MVCDKCKSHFRVMMSSFIVVVVVVLLYGLVCTRLQHSKNIQSCIINQSINRFLLTYDKTHMLTLNTELQYKKSPYESLYSMRIKKFLSVKCLV